MSSVIGSSVPDPIKNIPDILFYESTVHYACEAAVAIFSRFAAQLGLHLLLI